MNKLVNNQQIHQMFSPICLTNFSQFEQLKENTNLFFVFLCLPLEEEIVINIR